MTPFFLFQLFDRLKKEKPNALERYTVVDSDMTQPGLGLTPEARKMILEEVSVIFHLSALVRLEAPLRPAMQQNVHATRYILDLSLEMKKLEVSRNYWVCSVRLARGVP